MGTLPVLDTLHPGLLSLNQTQKFHRKTTQPSAQMKGLETRTDFAKDTFGKFH